jgi:hypothetical protein
MKNKQVGKGRFSTRINWGFLILIVGFVAFCVTWFVLKPMGVFG